MPACLPLTWRSALVGVPPADPDSLAPSGFQAPLEMEVPPGAATDSNGAEAAHPADGAGESTVGFTLNERGRS